MTEFVSDLMDNLHDYYLSTVQVVPKLGLAIIVFLIFLWIASSAARMFSNRVGPKMDDPLLVQFLSNVTRILIITIAFLIALKIIGLEGVATSIMAGAGVSAFVIGFAFKDIGENFLAGIMMAFKRPFRLNDTVELNGVKGKVIALNLRDTQVKTFDGKDVFIPNGAVVKSPVVNYTVDGFIRSDFVVGIDYNANIGEVLQLITKTLMGIEELEKEDRSPSVVVDELATSTINLRIFYWLDTFNPKLPGAQLKNMIIEKILIVLTDAGVYMPADIVEIKNYNKDLIKVLPEKDK